MPIGHRLGAGVGRSLGRRTQLRAVGSVGYIPAYSLVGEPSIPLETLVENPGLLPSVSIDYSLAKRVMYTSAGEVSLSHQLTRSGALTIGANVNRTKFANAEDPGLVDSNVSARYSQRLTRNLGFHVGYGHRLAAFSREGGVLPGADVLDPAVAMAQRTPVTIEDLDIGLDFLEGRTFALSRRASLDFSTGSAFSKVGTQPRRFSITGAARFSYAVTRNGTIGFSYNRGVQFVPGFAVPVFTDAVGLNASQGVGARLVLTASTNYSIGDVGGVGGAENRHTSLTGSARGSYRLSRDAQFGIDYLVYRHRLGQAVDVIQSVPRYQLQHSVRASVTYTLPIVRDMTRPQS